MYVCVDQRNIPTPQKDDHRMGNSEYAVSPTGVEMAGEGGGGGGDTHVCHAWP